MDRGASTPASSRSSRATKSARRTVRNASSIRSMLLILAFRRLPESEMHRIGTASFRNVPTSSPRQGLPSGPTRCPRPSVHGGEGQQLVPPDVRTGCEPTGSSVDRKSGEPVEKTFDRDRCLEARRGGAETVVGAVSETQGPHDGLCCIAVSYTHLRAHETDSYLVCRLR